MDAEKELIKLFYEIKEKGWIPTKRHGDQCLGNAFEDLIGKEEDNKSEADFHDIELKSHRVVTSSLLSLFSKSPSNPKGVNTYLRETYGVANADGFDKKVLNTTVSGKQYNTHRGGHCFKVEVDNENKKLWLLVKETTTDELVESPDVGAKVYWNFNVLERALEKKLKKIAILYGEEKDELGVHYVKYNKMVILEGLTLEKMLHAIEVGDLYIDIRIGVYASGKNIGKTHDHGTGFRIHLDRLLSYGETRMFE